MEGRRSVFLVHYWYVSEDYEGKMQAFVVMQAKVNAPSLVVVAFASHAKILGECFHSFLTWAFIFNCRLARAH